MCVPGCRGVASGGKGCRGASPMALAHMLGGVGVQQLGDGIVVAALPAPACPVHTVPPVPRPLLQAVPHLLQDLPWRQLLQESWVPAKPGNC